MEWKYLYAFSEEVDRTALHEKTRDRREEERLRKLHHLLDSFIAQRQNNYKQKRELRRH